MTRLLAVMSVPVPDAMPPVPLSVNVTVPPLMPARTSLIATLPDPAAVIVTADDVLLMV